MFAIVSVFGLAYHATSFPHIFFRLFSLCLLALLTKLANKKLTIYLVKKTPEVPVSDTHFTISHKTELL